MRLLPSFLAALGVVLLSAGCGGSPTQNSTTSDPWVGTWQEMASPSTETNGQIGLRAPMSVLHVVPLDNGGYYVTYSRLPVMPYYAELRHHQLMVFAPKTRKDPLWTLTLNAETNQLTAIGRSGEGPFVLTRTRSY